MSDTEADSPPTETEHEAAVRRAYEAGIRAGKNSAFADARRATRSQVNERLDAIESAVVAILRRLTGDAPNTTTTENTNAE
jgi:hypothetical protein